MRSCCQQIALRYKEKSKEKRKELSKASGRRPCFPPSSSQAPKRARSAQPAASKPSPVAAPALNVHDLNTIVHVPVEAVPEAEAVMCVTVEALPMLYG